MSERILQIADAINHEWDRRESQKKFDHIFPDHTHIWRGEIYHSRENYSRHMAFLAATKNYLETAFMAANRSGKTWAGGYAVACWLTGLYPKWWRGIVFPGPTDGWVAGKTKLTTRDILQHELCGKIIPAPGGRKAASGTGLIPGAMIQQLPSMHSGIADAIDSIQVRHISGGISYLGFKSYEQGRGAFEGTAKHWIWFDEECGIDVLGEATTRLMTKKGRMIHTFTPLDGISSVARRFLPGAKE